jgi:hypothetical protein
MNGVMYLAENIVDVAQSRIRVKHLEQSRRKQTPTPIRALPYRIPRGEVVMHISRRNLVRVTKKLEKKNPQPSQ